MPPLLDSTYRRWSDSTTDFIFHTWQFKTKQKKSLIRPHLIQSHRKDDKSNWTLRHSKTEAGLFITSAGTVATWPLIQLRLLTWNTSECTSGCHAVCVDWHQSLIQAVKKKHFLISSFVPAHNDHGSVEPLFLNNLSIQNEPNTETFIDADDEETNS